MSTSKSSSAAGNSPRAELQIELGQPLRQLLDTVNQKIMMCAEDFSDVSLGAGINRHAKYGRALGIRACDRTCGIMHQQTRMEDVDVVWLTICQHDDQPLRRA